MNNLVENKVADKIDAYFKAIPSETGRFWRVKMPYNKSFRWIEASKYFKFRYDIAKLFGEAE